MLCVWVFCFFALLNENTSLSTYRYMRLSKVMLEHHCVKRHNARTTSNSSVQSVRCVWRLTLYNEHENQSCAWITPLELPDFVLCVLWKRMQVEGDKVSCLTDRRLGKTFLFWGSPIIPRSVQPTCVQSTCTPQANHISSPDYIALDGPASDRILPLQLRLFLALFYFSKVIVTQ